MAKYCGTALPSMGEQCREQVNTGEDGSWELWGRVREPGSSISFGENLGRQIKTQEKFFSNCPEISLDFQYLWTAFPNYVDGSWRVGTLGAGAGTSGLVGSGKRCSSWDFLS